MKEKIKTYSIEELTDRYIGDKGTPERKQFEFELNSDVMGTKAKQDKTKKMLAMNFKSIKPIIFAVLVLLLSCEKPERDNPWDEKANIDPTAWAPLNLKIIEVSISEKKLTWTYAGDDRFQGFKLDRKKGDEAWQLAYQTFPKESRSWNDTEIIPDSSLTYSYRLYAFAGQHNSAKESASASAEFAAPTNLQIENLSEKSYKLTWTDNTIGEQGFKIDRKIDENDWMIAYGIVAESQTSFIDTNVFRSVNVGYRAYAFYESFESSKIVTNTDAELTSPNDLKIESNKIGSALLTWQYSGTDEDGFRIERKYEGGNWELVATVTGNSFEDNAFALNTQVYYSVYAFAGTYNSSRIEEYFDSTIPVPTNFLLENNSITSITLSWQDNSTGEDGFKIERRYEGGIWESFATVTGNSLEDSNFLLNTKVYYRVCTFVGTYNSVWVVNDFDSNIPAPENFNVVLNSTTSVKLTWEYNHTGHDGFKIDRKVNEAAWEEDFATLGVGQDNFVDHETNLQTYIYTYRICSFHQSYSSKYEEKAIGFACGISLLIDSRDGKEYETVKIGNQCWMKENLAFLPSVSPPSNLSQTLAYYYVYGYQGTNVEVAKATGNYQTYGVLYNWTAAHAACPYGWHSPTNNEWTVLTDYLGGERVGGEMKEAGTLHWNSPNIGATNSSGFTALPGGTSYGASFHNFETIGYWWSATQNSLTDGSCRRLYFNNVYLNTFIITKENGHSVRCLKN